MAKLKAPLFSLGARGQLGKALVYFPWKGLDCVREYVIPTNPNTDSQASQRNKLAAAVVDWHGVGLDAEDIIAWNRKATALPGVMTGFNAFCRDHINLQVAGETPDMGFNGSLTDDADHTFSASVEEDGSADGCLMWWGYSPTALVEVLGLDEGPADTFTGGPATDVEGRVIFARFEFKDGATTIGYSGIFRQPVA